MCDERIWGGQLWQVHSRSITFYTSQYFMAKLTEQDTLAPHERTTEAKELDFVELQIPQDADMDLLGNLLIISLRSDWDIPSSTDDSTQQEARHFKSGSVIYCDLETFLYEGPEAIQEYQTLFAPTERTAFEYFTCTQHHLIVASMDNVKSKLEFYKITTEGATTSLTFVGGDPEPQIRSSSVRPVDANDSDAFWFTTSDYITPSTLCWADAGEVSQQNDYVVESVKSLPPQFKADGLVIEQHMATSKDGTSIPYFMVRPKDLEMNGKNPTLLYGYGGFEISLGPHYIATSGLAWLERGGVYVEANIRGGGEFGPGWHQSALKEKRQACYDDFIAVAEDLIAKGICTPKTLAARGGSNGGLLMGNMYTMRPDLFGAIHCAVPLLDMKRYHTLLAGASWMAEYGDPDTDDWDNFLYKYSPYHNIDASVESYPPMLVTTSTRDDRVHPAHARKMVQKLWDLGKDKDWPVYYYENIEGVSSILHCANLRDIFLVSLGWLAYKSANN